jgi:nucleotide-binding universal stress UspA family protein
VAERVRSLVVGVDCLGKPDPVLGPAIELARRHGARLTVVHGYMLVDPLLDAYARGGYLSDSALVDHGASLQVKLERQIRELNGSADLAVRVVAAPAAAAITDVAEEVGADLLLVGTSRHDSFPLSLLGTTNRGVLRRATLPVLIMRAGGAVVPSRLLVATDLTPMSTAAYAEGVRLALSAGVTPTVRTLLVMGDSLLALPVEGRLLRAVAEQELARFTDAATVGPERVERVVRQGEPAAQILAEANGWGADLIVLGTHGRRGLERVLLGSVAEKTMRDSPCNVLIVPSTALPPGSATSEAAMEPQTTDSVPAA